MTEPDLARARWRKSSYSEGSNACVEVAAVHSSRGMDNISADHPYLVRDSQDPEGPVLALTRQQWQALLRGVKNAN